MSEFVVNVGQVNYFVGKIGGIVTEIGPVERAERYQTNEAAEASVKAIGIKGCTIETTDVPFVARPEPTKKAKRSRR